MIKKIRRIRQLLDNMGPRYVGYRIRVEIEKKIGILKNRHPINPPFKQFVSLAVWRQETPLFFFRGKEVPVNREPQESLRKRVTEMKAGKFVFFSRQVVDLGVDYDWITNPQTGYRYDIKKHWSEIEDFSKESGDIKYVWEKARFSFLTDLIRYDHHFGDDQSEFVFGQIMDFIEKNPINRGPNYRCSQETSLRILHWTLALYYYKDSPALTEARFQSIMNSIYWQLHHVYRHIDFSRIAVRNNHAITETLMLYLSGLLFPFFPNVAKWSKQGKKWFEEEVEYQIYPDGTFLQFSMNYHRVVVQLLTWGLRLAELHKDTLAPVVKERAIMSLHFLRTSQDHVSGELPNYGNNDGALFFKWTDDDYRDYTSQLNDLSAVLGGSVSKLQESQGWYGLTDVAVKETLIPMLNTFKHGGYYILQEEDVKTFIRCGAYKDRPSQSDNLHLDLWMDGINYLWDTGTYKYNTEKQLVDYFTGCEGHNTLSVAGQNQMLRGSRFIWFYWVKQAKARWGESEVSYLFNGEITAFGQLKKNIKHKRTVEKMKNKNLWKITDSVTNADSFEKSIYWHINPEVAGQVQIECKTESGDVLIPRIEEKWYSRYYGVKTPSLRYTYSSTQTMITTITLKGAP
ncbi:MAG: alginate lyase family protein [Flavobacteriaceae bacterium]|nr:alginate lyase family protein [Flavobacteriaceae bacterium]